VIVCGEASDGRATVEAARELRPDLMILDVRMPERNGIEVASVVKKFLPETKALLSTMYSDLVGHSIAAASGVDVILPKVDGAAALVDAIGRIVRDLPNPRDGGAAGNTP